MENDKDLLSKAIAAVDNLTNEQPPPPTASEPTLKVDKIEQPTVILMKLVGVVIHWDFYKMLDDYFKKKLVSFLTEKWDDPDVKPRIEEIKKTALQDEHSDGCPSFKFDNNALQSQQIESLAAYCAWVVSDPSKESVRQSVVSLRLKVWSEGWKKGTLTAPIYEDVLPAFKKWKSEGKEVLLYFISNAEVEAQQRWLTHTTDGDLRKYVGGIITTGASGHLAIDLRKEGTFKQLIESYLSEKTKELKDVLFLTRDKPEAAAAIQDGLTVRLVRRREDTSDTASISSQPASPRTDGFAVIESFSQINF